MDNSFKGIGDPGDQNVKDTANSLENIFHSTFYGNKWDYKVDDCEKILKVFNKNISSPENAILDLWLKGGLIDETRKFTAGPAIRELTKYAGDQNKSIYGMLARRFDKYESQERQNFVRTGFELARHPEKPGFGRAIAQFGADINADYIDYSGKEAYTDAFKAIVNNPDNEQQRETAQNALSFIDKNNEFPFEPDTIRNCYRTILGEKNMAKIIANEGAKRDVKEMIDYVVRHETGTESGICQKICNNYEQNLLLLNRMPGLSPEVKEIVKEALSEVPDAEQENEHMD